MGALRVSTVLTAAQSYDLTDLATVKDELSLLGTDTSKDAFLSRAITQCSKIIANYCNRVFAVETVQDVIDIEQDPYPYQTPGGFMALQLSRFPLVSVKSVLQTTSISTTQTLIEGTDFRADAENGWLIRLNAFTGVAVKWEPLPVTVQFATGFSAPASEAKSVPASAPYTVTVSKADAFGLDQGVTYANGTALDAVTGTPNTGEYAVSATGVYTFASGDAGASVVITYAYTDIPDDLVAACLRLVTARYHARGRDPALMSRSQPSLGDERFWIGSAPGTTGPFPSDIQALLDGSYRVPVAV